MKYLFVAFNVVALIICAWVITALPEARQAASSARGATAGLPEVPSLDDSQRQKLTVARKNLERLAALMERQSRIATDQLLATAKPPPTEAEVKAKVGAAPAEETPPPPLPDRNLTLVLDGEHRMAMVDDILVQEGDPLPGGGRVARIGARNVIVDERGARQQELTLPNEQLRLGTLRPSDPGESDE